ncbi:YceI family protein [Leucobacter sp. UCMA 4100]|uniref:YceI family protein n=1 Tax=Leucobacter sp. UCMA 4100 TaxID=2810534 RepID=UPI0022EA922E|nr:YceI family protein [Leucobacter sp. UCMA 4100]MDA3148063.1 YceI family protein [Leucobacter sp. UCMA 4100]
MTITAEQIPGYQAGTWTIDPAHSEVTFSVRHMAISKVKGRFENFDATFVTAPNPLDSTVKATVEVASVNTKQAQRDEHLRTSDFFKADEFPQLTFESTGAREENGELKVDGNLTMRGVTKPVTFDFEFGGVVVDGYGQTKAGFEAKTVVNREDFGVNWNSALDQGGFVLASDVTIALDVQATLQQ